MIGTWEDVCSVVIDKLAIKMRFDHNLALYV